MQDFTGLQISGYRIERLLHQGTESAVYEATQLSLERKVAIKFFPVYDAAAFNNSMKQIATPVHPNIVPVYDYGTYEGYGYVVMMLIKGASLAEHHDLSFEESLDILTQVAAALHYAHLLGFIHNNLKPSNILMDEKGRPWLTDFRVMGVGRSSDTVTAAGSIRDAEYLSPELGRGEIGSKASDIYSLGIIAYQMLTGKLPYVADTPMRVIVKHLNAPVPDLPGVPDEIAQAVQRALSKLPDTRFSSAYEFQKALQSYLEARRAIEPAEIPDWLADVGVSDDTSERLFPPGKEAIDDLLKLDEDDEATRPHQPVPEPVASPRPGGGSLLDDLRELPFDRDIEDENRYREQKPGAAVPPPAPPVIQPAAPPPQMAAPGRIPTEKPGVQRQILPIDTPPEFSAFYPEKVQANQSYALMVLVYLAVESVRDQMRELAGRYAGMMGGRQAHAVTSSTIQVTEGTLITLVPQIEGIVFNPPEHTVRWTPQTDTHKSAIFLFTTPAGLTQDLTGRVLVFNGPLILGEIPITMQRVGSGAPMDLSGESQLKPYESVFASYSHRDTPVMEYFRRQREKLGQKMLVDIYDLRAGDHWADRLLDMIDRSTAFQLFWSQHSADSKYCRQEWQHALKYIEERPRFIQPVWWEDPMPLPPPELEKLHFQRIFLPPVTRLQIVASRLRNIFRG